MEGGGESPLLCCMAVARILYLMKRTWKKWDQCRIGYTNLLSSRAGIEGADCAWQLMLGTEFEMRMQEQILSPQFGIPQTVWRARDKGNTMPQWAIDHMWKLHEDNWYRGKDLLRVLDVSEDNPTWKVSEYHRNKQLRQQGTWSLRCSIDICKETSSCQSPNSCKGALNLREMIL
jgi:hypothetical protein